MDNSRKRKTEEELAAFQLDMLVCANRKISVVAENEYSCRLRVMLRHSAAARCYGKIFPLRDHHDIILEGIGMHFFQRLQKAPVTLGCLIGELSREHLLSFQEARLLAVEYIGRLMRRGLVVVEVPAVRTPNGEKSDHS